MICLTVSVLLEALALAELELELELEHPAVLSRLAAMTVAPSQVAVRRLKVFTKLFVCDPNDARRSGVERAGERPMARRGPNSKELSTLRVSADLSAFDLGAERAVRVAHERAEPDLQVLQIRLHPFSAPLPMLT